MFTTKTISYFAFIIQNTPVFLSVLMFSFLTADSFSSVVSWSLILVGRGWRGVQQPALHNQYITVKLNPLQHLKNSLLNTSFLWSPVACYALPRALKWEYVLIWCAPMQSWPNEGKRWQGFECVCLVGYHQSLLVWVCLDSGVRHQWGFGGGLQASGDWVDPYPTKNTEAWKSSSTPKVGASLVLSGGNISHWEVVDQH